MNDTVKFLKAYNRICHYYDDCRDCPLSALNNKADLVCHVFIRHHPEKAVEIIEAWAKEHPEKTYKQDLLEKLPNTKLNERGVPYSCREYLYGNVADCTYRNGDCVGCWNEPMEG